MKKKLEMKTGLRKAFSLDELKKNPSPEVRKAEPEEKIVYRSKSTSKLWICIGVLFLYNLFLSYKLMNHREMLAVVAKASKIALTNQGQNDYDVQLKEIRTQYDELIEKYNAYLKWSDDQWREERKARAFIYDYIGKLNENQKTYNKYLFRR